MALVAVEQRFPPDQRILVDEQAGQMLPFGGRALLAATALPCARNGLVLLVDKAFPGLWAGVTCRKRLWRFSGCCALGGIHPPIRTSRCFTFRPAS
jgi:hypothetical protein